MVNELRLVRQPAPRRWAKSAFLKVILACMCVLGCVAFRPVVAQTAVGEAEPATAETTGEDTAAPTTTIGVTPTANDQQIADRLRGILVATEWFTDPVVRVDEGVVFLRGQARTDEHRTWAGNLARSTQDVAAVVNRIEVVPGPIWDFSPANAELRNLVRQFVQSLPSLLAAAVLLLLSWLVMLLVGRLADRVVMRRVPNRLLRQVITRTISIPLFILGVYLALRVSGLTRLAATVLGGTGLVGIILGIAFRDIAENFLASLLISIQSPYRVGDFISVDGHEGIVQSVTTRGTQLMTLDGNHVQIPNSTIYKSVITNSTSNPNVRLSFVVGVDYEDPTADAQNIVLGVLEAHDAVLADPEPLVLVDELASATVNLRVYFWINAQQTSVLKARSSVLRLTKRALQQAGFTLPDESREVIFPRGVPVVIQQEPPPQAPASEPPKAEEQVSRGEGSLESEAGDIQRQADSSRSIATGENLIAE